MMKIIQHNIVTLHLLIIAFLALSYAVIFTPHVSATGLKITPLKYEEVLELGSDNTGYVDVANPNDFTITVRTSVEAFRQINPQGELEFFVEERYRDGITIDVDEFELKPREAARILFRIDSNNLPEGGVYAVLFFETDALASAEQISSVGTRARVGTLLILQNGVGEKSGEFSGFNMPFWQFGGGLKGTLSFLNTDGERAVGFTPELSSRILPWGRKLDAPSGLVLPGVTREFEVNHPGSYFGLLPVTVSDDISGDEATAWVFAVSGIWRIILPLLFVASLASIFILKFHSAKRP